MLLDSERYEAVIAYGKEAINQLDDNKIEAGFPIAKQWLDRMVENNNTLHLFESEIEHMQAKYEFETGNKEEAFQLWKNLVKQKGVGYRYFEYDDPKYKEFYNTRK